MQMSKCIMIEESSGASSYDVIKLITNNNGARLYMIVGCEKRSNE